MSQFKLAASVLVSTLLFTSPVFAQTSLKGEVMPSGMHNWTGYYAGLNLGAVNHTMNITDNNAVAFNATIQQVSNPRFTGGLQLGYRRQLAAASLSGVYGVELSADFSDASFKKEYGSPFALYQLESENKLKDVCLLQLTGGIAADRTLLFLAGGLSWTRVTGSTTNVVNIPFFNSFSADKSEFGTSLGAGIEYAFTDQISARIKVDVVTPHTYSTSDNAGDSFTIANSIVQGTLGINYNFA